MNRLFSDPCTTSSWLFQNENLFFLSSLPSLASMECYFVLVMSGANAGSTIIHPAWHSLCQHPILLLPLTVRAPTDCAWNLQPSCLTITVCNRQFKQQMQTLMLYFQPTTLKKTHSGGSLVERRLNRLCM